MVSYIRNFRERFRVCAALKQRIIDASIQLTKRRARRKACVDSDGRYFEHIMMAQTYDLAHDISVDIYYKRTICHTFELNNYRVRPKMQKCFSVLFYM